MLQRNRFTTLIAILLCMASCKPAEQLAIIPRPVEVKYTGGWCNTENLQLTTYHDPSIPSEGYVLDISRKGIRLSFSDDAGYYYGCITGSLAFDQYGAKMPAMHIVDYPRFQYRGAHIDVSRHFFSKEVIMKQLRAFAGLKINRFHWHLTDGIAWRLQIDAYPGLTDGVDHYTKDDVREVLALAEELHITVIPEIVMFGHSGEVLAAYPELECGGIHESSNELCIGSEKTFEFLETVLGEVMDLFPSEYIHIGGDEANMDIWAACPKCRARMKAEGFTDVRQLQSYGIQRIEKFVNSRGRKIIGWDEILEGGLAENAVVMSWRGEDGGRAAAAMGHGVVMTPGTYCYLDACQDAPYKEPLGFGGFLPLSRIYSYDPAPADMPGREYVLGVQTNLWTELVETPKHLEYMLYPRVFALAEIAWSPVEGKDYDDFLDRALNKVRNLREMDYNTFDLANEIGERPEYFTKIEHLALGCPVTYGTQYDTVKYSAGGDGALTDGLLGPWTFKDRWQGFGNCDVIATIDLGDVKDISEIKADFTQWHTAWICMPVKVEFEISSDGENFEYLGEEASKYDPEDDRPLYQMFAWNGNASGRYVRVLGRINERKWGWLFVDEIIVN